MTKPWKTDAWKKKREELIRDKCCEWCGSTENLSVAHKERALSYDQDYRIVSNELWQTLVSQGKYSTPDREEGEEDNDYRRRVIARLQRDREDFRSKYANQIEQAVDAKRQMDFQKYMSFEDVMILCKKCHFAYDKGMVLCDVCRKAHHEPKYDMCWFCFSKTETGHKIKSQRELLDFIHPWCGKTFKIERQWWDIESDPEMCCIEHCDPYACKTAEEKFAEIRDE